MLWIRSREIGMFDAIRLTDPCQAETARINEPLKRGAIGQSCIPCLKMAIAESSVDLKSGDRYV